MKNRKCPQKNHCWGYTNNSCEDCTIGKAIIKLNKKIDRLRAENEKLKAENARLNTRLNIINNPDF